jgi:DmsE family decaheme c-type cytochrome
MTRSRFYLLAASVTAMLAFGIVTTGGEAIVVAAPQSAALPPNHPVITTASPAAREGILLPQGGAAPQRPAATQAPPSGDYVGEDTCLGCHDDKGYKGSKHGLTLNERTPAATHGCESCHGPGKAHAESGDPAMIRNPKTMKPQEASQICATCHNRSTHILWDGSQHDNRNVGCVSCHSVHQPVGEHQLVKRTEMETCATCHQAIVNKHYRFSHMPVREGQMQCSSCHNPHGSSNVRLLKSGTTIDESCTTCHADKRGPYLWEHAPVTESCVTCHDPHGTNNERMLVSKVPFLCQRCHVTSRHPPTVYEGYLLNNSSNGNKISGRGCVVCHQMIHGSNAPSGQTLLR